MSIAITKSDSENGRTKDETKMVSTGVTGNNTAASGSGPVRSLNRSLGDRLAGKIAEFGDRLFLLGDRRGAVEKYITTTEYMAEYVGRL